MSQDLAKITESLTAKRQGASKLNPAQATRDLRNAQRRDDETTTTNESGRPPYGYAWGYRAQNEQPALSERPGRRTGHSVERIQKGARKDAARGRRAADEDESQTRTGASQGAPYGYAWGYRAQDGQRALTGRPGRRTGQPTDQQDTTGSLNSASRSGRTGAVRDAASGQDISATSGNGGPQGGGPGNSGQGDRSNSGHGGHGGHGGSGGPQGGGPGNSGQGDQSSDGNAGGGGGRGGNDK